MTDDSLNQLIHQSRILHATQRLQHNKATPADFEILIPEVPDNISVFYALCNLPIIPEYIIQILLQRIKKEDRFYLYLLKNPSLPYSIIDEMFSQFNFAKREDDIQYQKLFSSIAQNPNLSSAHIQKLITTPIFHQHLAKNKSLNPEHFSILLANENMSVVNECLANITIPVKYIEYAYNVICLSKTKEAIASNPKTPMKILKMMVDHPSDVIQSIIALNPSASELILKKLIKNGLSLVLPKIASRMEYPKVLEQLLKSVLKKNPQFDSKISNCIGELVSNTSLTEDCFDILLKCDLQSSELFALSLNSALPKKHVMKFLKQNEDIHLKIHALTHPNIDQGVLTVRNLLNIR
jgi:hypothetical protein